ncbi:MAG: YaiI/YqxD family protein [Syntrophomonadaceae bacterium]|jgi:uncharacterized protein YaiI (UPF0178 family)
MKILVDADACPVKDIIETIARQQGVAVTMFCNPHHAISSDYSQVVMVDFAPEAVDLAIINQTRAGDIVVSQDYGLASLVLARRAHAIHPSGKIFDAANIDTLLTQRYLNARARRAGQRIPGPAKRGPAQDERFKQNLLQLLQHCLPENKEPVPGAE